MPSQRSFRKVSLLLILPLFFNSAVPAFALRQTQTYEAGLEEELTRKFKQLTPAGLEKWGGGPPLLLALVKPDQSDRRAVIWGFNEAGNRLWMELTQRHTNQATLSFKVDRPDGSRPDEEVIVFSGFVLNEYFLNAPDENETVRQQWDQLWDPETGTLRDEVTGPALQDFFLQNPVLLPELVKKKAGVIAARQKQLALGRPPGSLGLTFREPGPTSRRLPERAAFAFDVSSPDPSEWKPLLYLKVNMDSQGVVLNFLAARSSKIDREPVYADKQKESAETAPSPTLAPAMTPAAGVEEVHVPDADGSLRRLQEWLTRPEVTGGKGIRARVLTGLGRQSYDALVVDQIPSGLVPELAGGLSPLLSHLNSKGSFTWGDVAGGLGAALMQAVLLFPNLSPVLVDAVRWNRDQFDPAILSELEHQAKQAGVDLWSRSPNFLQAAAQSVDLRTAAKSPLRLITMMNALAYNEDPLRILANLYNQLEPDGILVTNLYIPVNYARAGDLVKFYERLQEQLNLQGVAADFRIRDWSATGAGERNSLGESGPFFEYSIGMVLGKQGNQRLEVIRQPESEPVLVENKTVRDVTYQVAWYGEDPAQAIRVIPAAGLEEGKALTPSEAIRILKKPFRGSRKSAATADDRRISSPPTDAFIENLVERAAEASRDGNVQLLPSEFFGGRRVVPNKPKVVIEAANPPSRGDYLRPNPSAPLPETPAVPPDQVLETNDASLDRLPVPAAGLEETAGQAKTGKFDRYETFTAAHDKVLAQIKAAAGDNQFGDALWGSWLAIRVLLTQMEDPSPSWVDSHRQDLRDLLSKDLIFLAGYYRSHYSRYGSTTADKKLPADLQPAGIRFYDLFGNALSWEQVQPIAGGNQKATFVRSDSKKFGNVMVVLEAPDSLMEKARRGGIFPEFRKLGETLSAMEAVVSPLRQAYRFVNAARIAADQRAVEPARKVTVAEELSDAASKDALVPVHPVREKLIYPYAPRDDDPNLNDLTFIRRRWRNLPDRGSLDPDAVAKYLAGVFEWRLPQMTEKLKEADRITSKTPFASEEDAWILIQEVLHFMRRHPKSEDLAAEILRRIDKNEPEKGPFADAVEYAVSRLQEEPELFKVKEPELRQLQTDLLATFPLGGPAAGLEENKPFFDSRFQRDRLSFDDLNKTLNDLNKTRTGRKLKGYRIFDARQPEKEIGSPVLLPFGMDWGPLREQVTRLEGNPDVVAYDLVMTLDRQANVYIHLDKAGPFGVSSPSGTIPPFEVTNRDRLVTSAAETLKVVVSSLQDKPQKFSISVGPVNTTRKPALLWNTYHPIDSIRFSPDGQRVIVRQKQAGYFWAVDLSLVAKWDEPVILFEHSVGAEQEVGFSPDGRDLYIDTPTAKRPSIRWVKLQTKEKITPDKVRVLVLASASVDRTDALVEIRRVLEPFGIAEGQAAGLADLGMLGRQLGRLKETNLEPTLVLVGKGGDAAGARAIVHEKFDPSIPVIVCQRRNAVGRQVHEHVISRLIPSGQPAAAGLEEQVSGGKRGELGINGGQRVHGWNLSAAWLEEGYGSQLMAAEGIPELVADEKGKAEVKGRFYLYLFGENVDDRPSSEALLAKILGNPIVVRETPIPVFVKREENLTRVFVGRHRRYSPESSFPESSKNDMQLFYFKDPSEAAEFLSGFVEVIHLGAQTISLFDTADRLKKDVLHYAAEKAAPNISDVDYPVVTVVGKEVWLGYRNDPRLQDIVQTEMPAAEAARRILQRGITGWWTGGEQVSEIRGTTDQSGDWSPEQWIQRILLHPFGMPIQLAYSKEGQVQLLRVGEDPLPNFKPFVTVTVGTADRYLKNPPDNLPPVNQLLDGRGNVVLDFAKPPTSLDVQKAVYQAMDSWPVRVTLLENTAYVGEQPRGNSHIHQIETVEDIQSPGKGGKIIPGAVTQILDPKAKVRWLHVDSFGTVDRDGTEFPFNPANLESLLKRKAQAGKVLLTLQGDEAWVSSPAAGLEEKGTDLIIPGTGPVVSVAYNHEPENKTVVAANADGRIFYLDRESGHRREGRRIQHTGDALVARFSASGSAILVVGRPFAASYSAPFGSPMGERRLEFDRPLRISPEEFYPGRIALSPGRTSMLVVEDGATSAVIRNLDPERREVPSGAPRQVMAELKPDQGVPTSVAYRWITPTPRANRDGHLAAVGTSAGTIELWDTRNVERGEPNRFMALTGHPKAVISLAFDEKRNRTARKLASGDTVGQVRIWDVYKPAIPQVVQHHSQERVQALAFSPSEQLLASTGESGTIYFWNSQTGELRGTIEGGNPIFSMEFSPDGKKITAGFKTGRGKIWSVPAAAGVEEKSDSNKWDDVVLPPQDVIARLLADLRAKRITEVREPVHGLSVGWEQVAIYDKHGDDPDVEGASDPVTKLMSDITGQDFLVKVRLRQIESVVSVSLFDKTINPDDLQALFDAGDQVPDESAAGLEEPKNVSFADVLSAVRGVLSVRPRLDNIRIVGNKPGEEGEVTIQQYDSSPEGLVQMVERDLRERFGAGAPSVLYSIRIDGQQMVIAQPVHVALSIGGTKIAAGVLNQNGLFGEASAQPKAITWAEVREQSPPTEHSLERSIRAMMDQVEQALQYFGLNVDRLAEVGISWAGPGDYDAGQAENEKLAADGLGPNSGVNLGQELERALQTRFGRSIRVQIMHDGAAGALGEHNLPNGVLYGQPNGMAVIFGTGIGAGIIQDGKTIYAVPGKVDAFLGEVGWHLVTSDGVNYEYRGTGAKPSLPFPSKPQVGEWSVEQELAGPWLAASFVQKIRGAGFADQALFEQEITLAMDSLEGLGATRREMVADVDQQKFVLQRITELAKDPEGGYASPLAREFIRETGAKFGNALRTFRAAYADQPFVQGPIVLISTLGENFGVGVTDESGEDLFMRAVRDAAGTERIFRSKMGYEREFAFSMPTRTANTGPEETLSVFMATTVLAEVRTQTGLIFVNPQGLAVGATLKYASDPSGSPLFRRYVTKDARQVQVLKELGIPNSEIVSSLEQAKLDIRNQNLNPLLVGDMVGAPLSLLQEIQKVAALLTPENYDQPQAEKTAQEILRLFV